MGGKVKPRFSRNEPAPSLSFSEVGPGGQQLIALEYLSLDEAGPNMLESMVAEKKPADSARADAE